jgi:hypothetical protein
MVHARGNCFLWQISIKMSSEKNVEANSKALVNP